MQKTFFVILTIVLYTSYIKILQSETSLQRLVSNLYNRNFLSVFSPSYSLFFDFKQLLVISLYMNDWIFIFEKKTHLVLFYIFNLFKC